MSSQASPGSRTSSPGAKLTHQVTLELGSHIFLWEVTENAARGGGLARYRRLLQFLDSEDAVGGLTIVDTEANVSNKWKDIRSELTSGWQQETPAATPAAGLVVGARAPHLKAAAC
jgi:hypothetical protein